jgi:putative ABC transport system permease protein
LAGIGIFALILSGFMVVNTISSILTQQRRQIGMMKAVGAASGQVVGVYLVTVTVFGLLALLVAVPVGVGLAWLNAQAVAGFLNVDIINFRLPSWVLLLQVLTALIVPLVAALVPVLSGTRVTVREAISDYGIGQAKKVGWFDRLVGRVRGLPRPMMLSLRNTFRRKGRLALTLTTLTLAGAIFIAVVNVRGSMLAELDKILQLFQYDIQVSLDGLYGIRQIQREALRVEGVNRVEGWAFAQAQRIRPDTTEGATFTIFGPPADTGFIRPIVLEGRWLEADDQNAIVLSLDVLRDESDIQVGDEIRLLMGDEKRDWYVVGIIDRVGQPFAYANFSYLSRIQGYPGSSAVVMVGTTQHDGVFQADVARTLEERLKRSGIGVSGTLTLDQIYGANVAQFDFLIAFMLVMAVMLAIVGGLGLTGTMGLNVLERTREIGVIRAIGARNRAVTGIVLVEGLLIGLISWFLGALVSLPLSWGLATVVGLAFFERAMGITFSPLGVVAWLVIAMVLATLASTLPARNASRISVREALAYE